jgi:5-methylcytosine-specific restriction enzyme subunit McrC
LAIPIKNIYYLLCYAWDKLEEGEIIKLSNDDYTESINLFSRVLITGCTRLFKLGLARNYKEHNDEYLGVKGKIDFTESLNRNLFKQGKSFCQFDEFDIDILPNQILKATLKKLLVIDNVDKDLKTELVMIYKKLHIVSDIKIKPSLFYSVVIHRNNSFYDFLLKVCKLIFDNTVLDESTGKYRFREFIGSEKAMANLFENFVRNFFKKEQVQYSVKREDILWNALPIAEGNLSFLPKMQTDITLEGKYNKIIIETKYYAEALSSRFESDKFISSNLYQIYSYLRNIEHKKDNSFNLTCDGILLYPAVGYSLNEQFRLGSHRLKIMTVDLNKSWKEIHRSLLSIVIEDEPSIFN